MNENQEPQIPLQPESQPVQPQPVQPQPVQPQPVQPVQSQPVQFTQPVQPQPAPQPPFAQPGMPGIPDSQPPYYAQSAYPAAPMQPISPRGFINIFKTAFKLSETKTYAIITAIYVVGGLLCTLGDVISVPGIVGLGLIGMLGAYAFSSYVSFKEYAAADKEIETYQGNKIAALFLASRIVKLLAGICFTVFIYSYEAAVSIQNGGIMSFASLGSVAQSLTDAVEAMSMGLFVLLIGGLLTLLVNLKKHANEALKAGK